MQAFILRRVLLMVPTLFGISLVTWLVMMLAPGRPGSTGGSLEGSTEQIGDMTKELEKGKAQRNFRRQYGLDRPLFVNTWYDLSADELLKDIETQKKKIADVGAAVKRKAKERLEDYGTYAVPPLMELLNRADLDDGTRHEVLRWLLRSSYTPPIETGDTADEETLNRNREIRTENLRLGRMKWRLGDPREKQDPVIAQWNTWYEDNRGNWEYGAFDKAFITITDTSFGTYWGKLATGDLGQSVIHKRPVLDLVAERMKYSIALNVTALLIVFFLAIPIGVWAAVYRGTKIERFVGVILFALYSLPNFFIATLLVKWFAAGEPYKVFPISGFESTGSADLSTSAHLSDILKHITLPLICLTYGGFAGISRYARAGMLDQIRSDYVRTARAKGVGGFKVITRHVLRNGVLPIITLLGTSLPVIIGGSVAIEFIFGINGMGLLMFQSVMAKDFNVIMGVQLMVGVLTMIGILISDITYAILDPRISLR
ncbi:MAG: ABC transporter permease [Planctomycetota bacterium]